MELNEKKRLLNRIALITGAGSGIGRATSLRFAKEGASVIVVDKNMATSEETVSLIEKEIGRKAIPVQCDISNISDVKSLVKTVFQEFPRLDILVNNAGIGNQSLGQLTNISEKVWDEVMNVNLRGTWLMTKYLARKMKKQELKGELRGKIINISSLAGRMPASPLGVYSISKAGVIKMTQIFAQELGPFKITVNALLPGFHVTAIYLNDENLVKQAVKLWGGKIALERIGTAEDVANAIYILASDDSNYITGQSLNCGGGCVFS